MKLYIGIDLGTSAAKLLLVDEQGTIQKSVTREYPLLLPQPGWSEQEPENFWISPRRKRPRQLYMSNDHSSRRGTVIIGVRCDPLERF